MNLQLLNTVRKETKTIVLEGKFDRTLYKYGWGNGYTILPKEHPLYGQRCDDLIDVHGGITLSEIVDDEMIELLGLDENDKDKWCFGFDTHHCWDDLDKWPKDAVIEEAENMTKQFLSLKFFKR